MAAGQEGVGVKERWWCILLPKCCPLLYGDTVPFSVSA